MQAVVHIPRATINRISNKESGAKPGDIIRYTVKVKRLDTVQTERIRLVESLPSELEYLGNVSIDYGHITNFNEISVNDENYNLEFDIALIDYLPDMNGELTLSYDVRVLRESNTSPTINTLSHLYCYAYPVAQARPTVASESSGSFEDSVIYRKTSRLHMIKYIKDVISNNISAKIVWIDGVNLPEYVDVRLYKDDIPYSDFVRLTAANNWEYTWNVTYKDPSISTPSNSSPSNAATPSPVQWYVKQETVWDGYTSSLVVLPNNRYVFTNRYIAEPAKPDSNNKTDNSDNNSGDNNNKSNNSNSNSDNKNSNDNNNSNNSKNSNSNNNNESKKPSIPNATENRKEESGDIVSNEKLSSAVKSWDAGLPPAIDALDRQRHQARLPGRNGWRPPPSAGRGSHGSALCGGQGRRRTPLGSSNRKQLKLSDIQFFSHYILSWLNEIWYRFWWWGSFWGVRLWARTMMTSPTRPFCVNGELLRCPIKVLRPMRAADVLAVATVRGVLAISRELRPYG